MIKVRKATKEDASFICWGLHTALHLENKPEDEPLFTKIILRDDVLYSWKKAFIAEDAKSGERLGLLLGYNGDNYHNIRNYTFSLFGTLDAISDYNKYDDETKAGEYYIDSLAVKPDFRCQGIGKQLLEYAISLAFEMDIKEIVLAVDPENFNAQRLYKKVGFLPAGNLFIFGKTYWRWAISKN